MAFLFGLQDTLLDFFEKGGGVVLFIGLLIIFMWSFILERFGISNISIAMLKMTYKILGEIPLIVNHGPATKLDQC